MASNFALSLDRMGSLEQTIDCSYVETKFTRGESVLFRNQTSMIEMKSYVWLLSSTVPVEPTVVHERSGSKAQPELDAITPARIKEAFPNAVNRLISIGHHCIFFIYK